jgi:predicted transposase YdaD
MKTDHTLKRLTELCPEDLLALLGAPASEVLRVETLQLPATSTSLDNLISLRGPDGRVFLHLIEWQGYTDPTFLWRVLHYVSWLGQRRSERPILVTVIYLNGRRCW